MDIVVCCHLNDLLCLMLTQCGRNPILCIPALPNGSN